MSVTKEVLNAASSLLSPCWESYQGKEAIWRKEGAWSYLLFGSVPPRSALPSNNVKQKSPCSEENISVTLDLRVAF